MDEVSQPSPAQVFLEERLLDCYSELVKLDRRLQATREGSARPLLEARRSHLDRELAIIDELYDRVAKDDLPRAVGAKLNAVQNGLFQLLQINGNGRSYPQQFWDHETDREILAGLLRDWRAWLNDPG